MSKEIMMDDKKMRFKSPPFPYVDLETAIDRAKQVPDLLKGFAVPSASIAKAWGYSEKSSSTQKVLAALSQFGLVDDEGNGDTKRFRLSEIGLKILLDPRPDSESKSTALRRAALTPKVFSELWDQFDSVDVDENTLVYELTLGRKQSGKAPYSDSAAAEVVSRYQSSLNFAGFSDNVQETLDHSHHESDDKLLVGNLSNRSVSPKTALAEPAQQQIFEEKKAFDEGEATLIWPRSLSVESVEDMEYWLDGVIRQMKRRAARETQTD